ncbi:MAG: hypothetical protein WA941_10235, partial [Nitrososphaeraceae archaeon]
MSFRRTIKIEYRFHSLEVQKQFYLPSIPPVISSDPYYRCCLCLATVVPEMGVRVGIDVGENAIVQYGWSTKSYTLIEDNLSNETNYRNGGDAQYHIDNKEAVRSTSDNSDSIK